MHNSNHTLIHKRKENQQKMTKKDISVAKGVFGTADRLGKESTWERKYIENCVSMVWFHYQIGKKV